MVTLREVASRVATAVKEEVRMRTEPGLPVYGVTENGDAVPRAYIRKLEGQQVLVPVIPASTDVDDQRRGEDAVVRLIKTQKRVRR